MLIAQRIRTGTSSLLVCHFVITFCQYIFYFFGLDFHLTFYYICGRRSVIHFILLKLYFK